MIPAPRPHPNPAFFASRTLLEHVLRGVVGAVALWFAIDFSLARPWPMLGALVVMLLAWRGCPRCWLVGLGHTLERRAARRHDPGQRPRADSQGMPMQDFEPAQSTLPRDAKGPMAPPPVLGGELQSVIDAVAAWPGVEASTHWHFADQSRVDGVDFYVGPHELGHLHLEGEIHLATSPTLGATLVAEGLGRPFRYARGWTVARVDRLGAAGAVALFRRNYERLRAA